MGCGLGILAAGFDKLWANIFRDLLPHAQASEATAELDRLPRRATD